MVGILKHNDGQERCRNIRMTKTGETITCNRIPNDNSGGTEKVKFDSDDVIKVEGDGYSQLSVYPHQGISGKKKCTELVKHDSSWLCIKRKETPEELNKFDSIR